MTLPVRRCTARRIAYLVGCVPLAATAPPAMAESVSGPAALTLNGPAANALKARGVTISAIGGASGSTAGGSARVVFSTTNATFATPARLTLGGQLVFRRTAGGRTRTISLKELRIRLASQVTVSAMVRGRRLDVLTLDVRPSEYELDRAVGVVRVSAARAVLTARGREALARPLGLSLRSRVLGVLTVTAARPSATTGSSGAAAVGAPAGAQTFALLPRPATAQTVLPQALRWHVRESFVRYLGGGEGVTALGGATAAPAAADGNVYAYDFPAVAGWRDVATGRAALQYSGRLVFAYTAHGIDVQVADPVVEITPEGTRMLATFASGSPTGYRGLGELLSVDRAAAVTAGSSAAETVIDAAPASITSWANTTVMSGFYPAPDDAFGWLTLRYSHGSS